MWKCVECGHEEEERWLMCPQCTTPEDWAEALASVRAGLREQHGLRALLLV